MSRLLVLSVIVSSGSQAYVTVECKTLLYDGHGSSKSGHVIISSAVFTSVVSLPGLYVDSRIFAPILCVIAVRWLSVFEISLSVTGLSA